jgi:LAS superfamily LD-carboxypeptidase LdcB
MNYKKADRNLIIMIGSGVAAFLLIVIAILYFNYTNGMSYKLGKVGYKKADANVIIDKLSSAQLKIVLANDYIKELGSILKDDYYIKANLERYISYANDSEDTSAGEVVALVNTDNDKGFYENIEQTDTAEGKLMIVNKHYGLTSNYVPDDLVTVAATYAYEGISLSQEAYTAVISLFKAAKSAGYTLIIDTGYRSYQRQQDAYDRWLSREDEESADAYVAHAGHSEHQTGLAFNLQVLPNDYDEFATTAAYTWLVNNAHKYGFILRYPEGKEAITGFKYESSHFRYVGVDVATEIKDLNITFDEYYAFNLK